LHIVEGTDWKLAVIALLDSRSPYRPWRYGFGEARKGDPVAIVLNTEPRTVMTSLGRIGVDGRRDRAVVEWPLPAPGLVDLDSLVLLVGPIVSSDTPAHRRMRDMAGKFEILRTRPASSGSGSRPAMTK
jgi:hypothetical protein